MDRRHFLKDSGALAAAWAAEANLGPALLPLQAGIASKLVWQIGEFNQSSAEFWQGSLFSFLFPKAPVVYIVGQSTPANDWPAFQPSSSNGRAGYHPYPYTIRFNLPAAPQGLYTVRIALLVETARVPQLRVSINGHDGLFYQHPKLNHANGDEVGLFMATYAANTITFSFPARFLQQGDNNLVLTAVDLSTARDNETNPGIVYDALAFEQDPTGKYFENEVTAQTEPTIFYVREGNDLSEVVEVYIRHNAPLKHGRVTFGLAGRQFQQALRPGMDFGEQLVEFRVPEFAATTPARLSVTINGHARRFSFVLTPAKKWTVFAVPHEHLDVGYPDYQAKVAETQSRVLDEAMDLIHAHPDFCFSVDGFWCARQFQEGRSKEDQQRLFEQVRKSKIFVPAQEACLLTGFASLETLIRSLYPGLEYNQRQGVKVDYANITDVPSYSWSYASVLAAAGLKYFFAGSDNGRGPILRYGHLNRQSPFWWEGPDGERVLMWYSFGYGQVSNLFGLKWVMAAGRDSLPLYLQAYSTPEYKADAALLYGTQVEDTDLFPEQATLVEAWNKLYAYPHMKYSGFVDAMKYIVRQCGSSIPVVRGDGGPYWEDGIASTARSAALERKTEQRALSAEKFSTISSLVNPDVRLSSDRLKDLWHSMVLYDEHTWGADVSVTDPKSEESVDQLFTKEHFGIEASQQCDYLVRRALDALADCIPDPKQSIIVFNPLNWQRSNLVEIDLDRGQELLDLALNKSVPYEVLREGKSYRHIRFLAHNVPSLGYKAYALRESTIERPPAPAFSHVETLENQFYRVELDSETGGIKTILDKELQKELVNTSSSYRFGQYLYVTGADQAPNRMIDAVSAWPIPKLSVHRGAGGRLLSVSHAPHGTVARLESSGINTPLIQTEITLFDGQKKIGLAYHLQKNKVYTKEGVYFAFPFAMERPRFRYEIQNGFVDPSRDQMPGAGKEWFSVQHWIAADQDGVTVALIPIDAALVTLGDIVRGVWPKEFGERHGTIFSYIMNNYWFTNYAAAQGGDFRFRYILTSGDDLDPGFLSRLGQEEMTPLEVDQIKPQDKTINRPTSLNAVAGSFLQVDQPNVVLITWKWAEDGEGTVMRFLEIAGKHAAVNAETKLLNVASGWTCDAFERKQGPLSTLPHGFKFTVKPFQIVTVRLIGTRTTTA
jgi:alpha-mannosidase